MPPRRGKPATHHVHHTPRSLQILACILWNLLNHCSEHYNRRMDEAFAGMQNFSKIVDDIIAFDCSQQEHVYIIRQLLRHCQEKEISLNPDKFQFCRTEVSFAGFTIFKRPRGTPSWVFVPREILVFASFLQPKIS